MTEAELRRRGIFENMLLELIRLALLGETIEYKPLAEKLGTHTEGSALGGTLRRPMDLVIDYCILKNWPNLTVLVLHKGDGLPGSGYFTEMRERFPGMYTNMDKRQIFTLESQKCFKFFS